MFKIIKKKLWKELVYCLEFEVMELESTIFVYEEVVKEDIPLGGDGLPSQAHIQRLDMYTIKLPGLYINLEGKRQLLKRLKGD